MPLDRSITGKATLFDDAKLAQVMPFSASYLIFEGAIAGTTFLAVFSPGIIRVMK